jgi:hypothetical protein
MTEQIIIHPISSNPSPYQARMAKAPEIQNDSFFESFADLLDVINPLQHIPLVSTAYRELTGDTISSGARIMGGALFGGPIGFVTALANEIVESVSGKDIGGNLFAMATGKYEQANTLNS